eukprot:Seg3760.1 transcript_id=Seg3760.1/GoldUCD/mRNA.D3Y31 product="Excitatory amino acid transporter 2" protein_id=Seg3760.1/GoldUCD/D3Y31
MDLNLREGEIDISESKKLHGKYDSPRSKKDKCLAGLKQNLLVIMIIVGASMGFVVGIASNKPIQKLQEPDRSTTLTLLGFPGELLIRMLKLLILPLIVSSLIVGLSGLDARVSGKLGLRAVCYYFSTTLIAVVIGVCLVSAIKPGVGADKPKNAKESQPVRPLDSFLDILRNMFPDNIMAACILQGKTKIIIDKQIMREYNHTITGNETASFLAGKVIKSAKNETSGVVWNYTTIQDVRKYKIAGDTVTTFKPNFLGLIVFSIAVGIVLGQMGESASTFIEFAATLNEVIMKLVILVMWYSPIGIWSLVSAKFAAMENIAGTFRSLGLFIATVITGIGIHSCLILPLIYFIIVRKNPFKFMKGLLEAMVTAFGTDSSAATLPVTFRCLEENNHIDKRVTRFVLPVGATINMDGTALYEAVAAMFIAQAVGQSLSIGDIIAISITSTLASVGAAAVPHAGLVTMLIVLDTVGLPSDYIGVIYSVDWFLDRCRTMANVMGDSIGAGIVQHLSKHELMKFEDPESPDDTFQLHPAAMPSIAESRQL